MESELRRDYEAELDRLRREIELARAAEEAEEVSNRQPTEGLSPGVDPTDGPDPSTAAEVAEAELAEGASDTATDDEPVGYYPSPVAQAHTPE